VIALGAGAAGCSTPPPPVAAPTSEAPKAERPVRQSVTVQAEIGALDEEGTRKVFASASRALGACFARGSERVPYLAGDVRFYVRIDREGRARYVYLAESSIGDRETEECMLRTLRAAAWPAPLGGDEGEARSEFHFEPGGGAHPVVAWTAANLGEPYRKARPALTACRRHAGAGPMRATFYVDPEGKPAAIGVSVSDARGEDAAACVIEALRGVTFTSPGESAAKVTIAID
jgi:hypothetical protein